MTRIKSLRSPSVRIMGDGTEVESGYRHRVHRSKKNRAADVKGRRIKKYILKKKLEKFERRRKYFL